DHGRGRRGGGQGFQAVFRDFLVLGAPTADRSKLPPRFAAARRSRLLGDDWCVTEPSGFAGLKRLLLGKPIPSHLAHHERLSRVTGLAVLSSDALSSVAYATDFILATLLVAGV